MPAGPVVGISILALFAAYFAFYVWSIIWSYRDAKCRGKSAVLVTLLVAVASPVGFLAWLIFRPAQPVSAPDPSHEGRWKWILGLGGAAFAAFIVTMVSSFVGIFHGFKETAAYVEAIDRLRNSPTAIEVLGSPIQDSIWISGSLKVEFSGGGEEAVIVPVSGPKGKGKLNLKATRSASVWRLQSLILDADGKQIDLLRSSAM